MTRHIKGLEPLTAHNLCKELPRIGIIEEHINDDLVTLVLHSTVILKIYDDHIVIDQGLKKVFLFEDQFEAIEIR